MEIVISSLLEQFLEVLCALLGLAIVYGANCLRSKLHTDKMTNYGDLLELYAERTVKAVAQTDADDMKANSANGKLSADQQAQLKRIAVIKLECILPDATLRFMKRSNSDTEALLGALIEAAVRDSKGGDLNGVS